MHFSPILLSVELRGAKPTSGFGREGRDPASPPCDRTRDSPNGSYKDPIPFHPAHPDSVLTSDSGCKLDGIDDLPPLSLTIERSSSTIVEKTDGIRHPSEVAREFGNCCRRKADPIFGSTFTSWIGHRRLRPRESPSDEGSDIGRSTTSTLPCEVDVISEKIGQVSTCIGTARDSCYDSISHSTPVDVERRDIVPTRCPGEPQRSDGRMLLEPQGCGLGQADKACARMP